MIETLQERALYIFFTFKPVFFNMPEKAVVWLIVGIVYHVIEIPIHSVVDYDKISYEYSFPVTLFFS